MSDISTIDANFKVETNIQKEDIRFYDVKQDPFKIYGVYYDSGKFMRLPESVAQTVSKDVIRLYAHTAGGRVRFKTNSPYVAIHAKLPVIFKMPHMAWTGSAGFDLYADGQYGGTFVPPYDYRDGYESCIDFESAQMREITIHFPLYSEVGEVYIGVSNTATIEDPEPYTVEKPIVYYGSSITQGACASRPGNAYQNIISRRLSCDHINLGFSGGAKGETEIAEYISGLDMSIFVYDYDYNALSVKLLQDTHEKMFKCIRAAHPEIPIVMMSRPSYYLNDEEKQRLEVIKTTYQNAKANGDMNVYMIEGRTLMEFAENEGTVDGCHPNDLGFASMAKVLGDVLKNIL